MSVPTDPMHAPQPTAGAIEVMPGAAQQETADDPPDRPESMAPTSSAMPVAPDRPPRLPAWIRAMRPQQWIKNLLVVTAPLAAGRIIDLGVLWHTALAFVVFCLASAAVYLLNDVRGIAEDRQHPRKRFRPIAAGELSNRAALILAAGCTVVALILGAWTSVDLGVTIVVYLALQVLYSTFLKHLPVLDLAMVASGFLLRAIAGGVASGIELSQWFLLVASFGSLFMVAGKRYSELVALGADAGTRRSLARYSATYLRFVWTLSAGLVLAAYCLWAFDNRALGPLRVSW